MYAFGYGKAAHRGRVLCQAINVPAINAWGKRGCQPQAVKKPVFKLANRLSSDKVLWLTLEHPPTGAGEPHP
ncbi:MAG: hypothetical protein OHK0023_18910 [Anaerolineae bacterium]